MGASIAGPDSWACSFSGFSGPRKAAKKTRPMYSAFMKPTVSATPRKNQPK